MIGFEEKESRDGGKSRVLQYSVRLLQIGNLSLQTIADNQDRKCGDKIH
jgi:hypothetical protein